MYRAFMDYWINIDYKRDFYRLHKADCRHVKKDPTETKGIQDLKEEGGWLKFKTRHIARACYQRNHHTLRWMPCQVCDP